MENLLNISSSPHIRSKVTSGKIMLYVLIALLPASAFGVDAYYDDSFRCADRIYL